MKTQRHSRNRKVASALTMALALVFTSCALAPADDAFYQPPGSLPSGSPGTIIRSRASTFTLDPITRAPFPDVNSWQVLYKSNSALGAPNAVSGTVLVPTTPWAGGGNRPLITYSVGTRGIGDNCAPSFSLSQGTDYEGIIISELLERGWAVSLSDYEGLGTPGTHPYVVGKSQGPAVLDMARAVTRLPGTGLSSSTPVAILGYSQGGLGAGWAAEMAPSYAPELDIKAAAVGGAPVDLQATGEYLDGGPFVSLELLAALGFDAAYPELDLDSVLNDRGRELFEKAQDECLVSADGIGTLLGASFSSRLDYVTSDPLEDPAWIARFEENKLGGVAPTMPVYQYHGLVDEVIPLGPAAAVRREWCDRGANVTWSVLPADHFIGLANGAPLAADFIADRLAGVPTAGNCLLP